MPDVPDQTLRDWATVLNEAYESFTEAEHIIGAPRSDRAREAYKVRNGARTKISNVRYHILDIARRAAEEDGQSK